MRRSLLVALLVALTGTGQAAPKCPFGFEDAAAEVGISFVHDRGATGRKRLPETMGSGVAWLDYDGDGWLDLYVVQSGPLPDTASADSPARANRLFRNRGRVDGVARFEAVKDAAGAADLGYGQGVTAGDLDGDGWVDLYVANYGADSVYRNQGGALGNPELRAVDTPLPDGWSSSAAFADADGDGDLDIYVTRYLAYALDHDLFCGDADRGLREYCGPELFVGASDRLLVQQRTEGTIHFEDATDAAGLSEADGKGLGVVFADLDDDGRADLYVANDQTINHTFHNLGPSAQGVPRFEDLSFLSGAGVDRGGVPEAGMGVAVGDVDRDGRFDLAVTNFDVETNTLYRNLGGLQFEDRAAASGFGPPSFNLLGFGVVLADFDLDGDLDAYVANGHVRERTRRESVTWAQPDLVLLGDGTGGFAFVANCFVDEPAPRVGRGLAAADFDGDGDVDLAVQNSGGPLQILRNGLDAGAWLGVRVLHGGAGVIGAEARLRRGDVVDRRVVLAGDSYQSTSSPFLHFGGVEPGAMLEVRWPSGRAVRLANPPVGADLVFRAP